MTKKPIERGQSITFRIPSDTPDYLLKQLTKIKETERRNFSSTIAGYVLNGVNESYGKERETITIPLPKKLTKEQKSWLKHEHSEALLGTLLYQLLNDPMRATALLTSINSNMGNMDDFYREQVATQEVNSFQTISDEDLDDIGADLLDFQPKQDEVEEEEDPLGDFFSSMNK